MGAIYENLKMVLPFFIGSWAFFLALTLWRPQRFSNSVFLMVALMFTAGLIAALFGEYVTTVVVVMGILVFFILLLVPTMLFINGVVMIKKESFAISNLLSLILGVVIGIGEIATFVYVFIGNIYNGYRVLGIVLFFIATSIIYFSVWILTYVVYMLGIQFMPHTMNFKYIIIHGCGLLGGERVSRLLANRIDKAIHIYNKCKVKPIIIPSGGRGSDESLSEAQAMKNYLLEKGIPEENIVIEDKSTTTLENLKFSRDVIYRLEYGDEIEVANGNNDIEDKRNIEDNKDNKERKNRIDQNDKKDIRKKKKNLRVALVSSNYHVYRCLLYSAKLKFKCTGIGAKVAWYYWPSATLREFAAVFTRLPHVIWIALGYVMFVIIPTFWMMNG